MKNFYLYKWKKGKLYEYIYIYIKILTYRATTTTWTRLGYIHLSWILSITRRLGCGSNAILKYQCDWEIRNRSTLFVFVCVCVCLHSISFRKRKNYNEWINKNRKIKKLIKKRLKKREREKFGIIYVDMLLTCGSVSSTCSRLKKKVLSK